MTPEVFAAVDRKNAERAATAMIAGCDACEALGRSAMVEAIAASALERGGRIVRGLAGVFARMEAKRVADASKTPAPRRRR
jgi:hypothetical protein